jgi:ATP-dependent protease ClpP protease subunit
MFIPPGMTYENYMNGLGINSCVFQIDRNTQNEILLHKLQKKNPPTISVNGHISELTADYVRTAIGILDLKYEDKKTVQNPPTVNAEITTFGGEVTASFGIAENLFQSGYAMLGLVREYAYSGGGIILQGCHGRYATENAKLMFHFCNTVAFVTAHGLQSSRTGRVKDELEKINTRMVEWVAGRINLRYKEKTLEERKIELRKLFVKERFLFPDEALHYHLIDDILEDFPRERPHSPPPAVEEGQVIHISTEQLAEILKNQNSQS